MQNNKITVVGGAGYIGLPFALILANAGFVVTCYDIDKYKIATLKNKTFFFDEKEIKKLYLNSHKKIIFTDQLSKSNFFFISLILMELLRVPLLPQTTPIISLF